MHNIARGLKILVAESDRAVLEMNQIRLDVAGFHTLTARTGHAAAQLLRNTRPNAMIIDLALPDMRGLELIAVVRDVYGPSMPIILTGRGFSPEDIKTAVSLGVRDCVNKPFGGSEIIERVARLLKKPGGPAAAGGAKAVVWV